VIRDTNFEQNGAYESISVLKSNKAKSVEIINSRFVENYSRSILISVQSTESFVIKDS